MTTETYKFCLLDLLARMDRKEPQVSYITKPLSVLDAFRFYDCPGYLTHWIEAAIELHCERLAWAESRNGMIYLQLSCGGTHAVVQDADSLPEAPVRASRGGEYSISPAGIYPRSQHLFDNCEPCWEEKPRTIKQLACELAAKEIEQRRKEQI